MRLWAWSTLIWRWAKVSWLQVGASPVDKACVGLEPWGLGAESLPVAVGWRLVSGDEVLVSLSSQHFCHSNRSSLPSSLFIKQVLGAIWMYRDSFTFLFSKSFAVSRISMSFQSISWPSCHVCSATADLSNVLSLLAALCSFNQVAFLDYHAPIDVDLFVLFFEYSWFACGRKCCPYHWWLRI